jgi:hypothetical protein
MSNSRKMLDQFVFKPLTRFILPEVGGWCFLWVHFCSIIICAFGDSGTARRHLTHFDCPGLEPSSRDPMIA